MKLTCDLCGGTLQMNAGGKDASCKNCGLCYPMDVLREKLGLCAAAKSPEPVKPAEPEVVAPAVQEEPVVAPVVSEEPAAPVVPEAPVTGLIIPPEPAEPVAAPEAREEIVETPVAEEPFSMQVARVSGGCLEGTVTQGSIGIGENVYLNGDYSSPYRVYRFDDDPNLVRATAGMTIKLRLADCPRALVKSARTVDGDTTPAENAYHFPGTVDEYFTGLLQVNFPEYKLRKNIAWEEMEVPVNYMLLKDGYPAIAIFVFDSHDAKSRYQAQKAMEVFGRSGVSCTHFYEEYRNEPAYVVDRIRSAMG